MELLYSPLRELGEYEEIEKKLSKDRAKIVLSGCTDSQKLHMLSGLTQDCEITLIVVENALKAKETADEYAFYHPNVMLYPAKDMMFYQADINSNRLVTDRMKVHRRLIEGGTVAIVTTLDSLMTLQVPLDVLKNNVISLSTGDIVDVTAVSLKLAAMGYENNYQVEAPGQFCVRGGIIDVFDLTEENPYRMELWGDTIDSIRSFDILSQRSIEKLEQVSLYPASEMVLSRSDLDTGLKVMEKDVKKVTQRFRENGMLEEAGRITRLYKELEEQLNELGIMVNLESYIRYFYPRTGTFLDFLKNRKSCVCFNEPIYIEQHGLAVEQEFAENMAHRAEKGYVLPEQMNLIQSVQTVFASLEECRVINMSVMELSKQFFKGEQKYSLDVKNVPSYNGSFEQLLKDLIQYKKKGYRILLMSGSKTRAKRLAESISENDIPAIYGDNRDRVLQNGEIMTFYGMIRHGFEYPMLKFVVLCESDIFGTEKKKKKRKRYEGKAIQDFNDLKVGDYVVHESYGLGIYRGIEKIEVEKTVKDYMKIEYRDSGVLYVIATGFDVIQKYASADAKTPKLNKLGTQEWSKTKAKVTQAVTEVAKDLVELYAKRQQQKGFEFSADTVWQNEFEELFPFEETEDQLLAIDATKSDMQSDKIMDRLICGDVGYGKTEIAIRAAFKAVQDNKQVVFLVPTTILAQQHYNTFVQRMKDFPVRIDLLSRFRSRAEQQKTIADLKKGAVDILIGTHRVLSGDVIFKDLGLLIVDEEQRFGVTHKEKIKKLKSDVDVLTLTATPIPRTLHMSMIGIRDMSVLEEAPGDRLPIQTYVMEYNEEMVREAIARELARGGQVYYVYNRVQSIADIAVTIAKLVPEANVAFAHGQMEERELESIMYDFIAGEIDVLVATTIIETGLDISNVNTMIIHDSDKMGLSQLYQLRGRVGRSNRTAYAFLMYKRDKILKEVAEKRLQAIREFTDLGSGFKIAMKDLEIRGAGNLLGAMQHGHMEAVGYDLYCKMLDEAIRHMKGEEIHSDFNTLIDLNVNAFIPAEYIVNEVQKLDIYKRIAAIETETELEDMRDELIDRFGTVPKSAENLLQISHLRAKAHSIFITDVKGSKSSIRVLMKTDADVRTEGIPELLAMYGKNLQFVTKGTPAFVLRRVNEEAESYAEREEQKLLADTTKLIEDMFKCLKKLR